MARRPSSQTLAVSALFLESTSQWHHGYDISKRLRIVSGTLYPILMRLHDRGHLETRWTESETLGRPARHMYRLTATGRDWAAIAVAEAQRPNPGVQQPAEGMA
jgi:DNA-binding PadR family transcriptional regulator